MAALSIASKKAALKKIVEHNRDYLKVELTLPLGNTALKKVHTNQWLFTDLPKEFNLANWTAIATALNADTNRYTAFVRNRWYIESVDIQVDANGKAQMKLGLNAFASSYNTYNDDYKGFEEAYNNAKNQDKNATTGASKNTSNAIANNTTIKNGWWGKWVTDTVKKTVGNETDTLVKCKKMYELFRRHARYSGYGDMPKTGGSPSRLEGVWKSGAHLNCGDGANFLSAFYSCCGATSGIYLTYDDEHYIVKCTINGKEYWTDQSGPEGGHNELRGWNQTWHGYRSGNYKGRYV